MGIISWYMRFGFVVYCALYVLLTNQLGPLHFITLHFSTLSEFHR